MVKPSYSTKNMAAINCCFSSVKIKITIQQFRFKIYGKQRTIFRNDTVEKTYVACVFQSFGKFEANPPPLDRLPGLFYSGG